MLHGRATTVLSSPQMIFRMKNENFQGLLWSFFREKVCSTTTIVVLKKSPWFGIHSAWVGVAKETAPVINIEINGVRGIWLTFLEWDIFLKKNWTDILYQTFRTNICCQIISWVSTSKLKSKCAIILLSKYLCWKVYLRKCKNTYFILQNKYLHIYEDSFGAKMLIDDWTLNL